MKVFEDTSEVTRKVLVKVEILYLQEASDVWMTGDSVEIVVLGPTANGPGKRSEAGQSVSMVDPDVRVMSLADGVNFKIDFGLQH